MPNGKEKNKASPEEFKRLVEINTIFSRCRQKHGFTDCGSSKTECSPCPFKEEKIDLVRLISKIDWEKITEISPEDVQEEMHMPKVTPSNCKLHRCKYNQIPPPENSQECFACEGNKDPNWDYKKKK